MRADPIREPLVGICVYIPGLRLELPSLLPDINLDDIRTLELPMPLLPVTQLRRGQLPGWMPVGAHLDFSDWNGVGVCRPACGSYCRIAEGVSLGRAAARIAATSPAMVGSRSRISARR